MILPFELCGPVLTRYFRSPMGVWKISPDGDAFIRAEDSSIWKPSIFGGGLAKMMKLSGVQEITAEEGEPHPAS